MKKLFVSISLCGILLAGSTLCQAQKKSVAKKPVSGFTISGTVKDADNEKILFSYEYNGKTIKDSAIIKEGKFAFKGVVAEPLFSQITIPSKKIFMGFFVENRPITITMDKGASQFNIEGSPTDVIYKEWVAKWKAITQKAGGIYQRMNEAYKAEGQNPNDRNAKLSDKARKGFDDEFAALTVETDSSVFPTVRKYPNSVASAFIAIDRYVSWNEPAKAQKVYDLLSPTVKKSVYGKQIKKYIEVDAKTAIGAMALDFTMNDTTGKPVKLSGLRGQYVLVDFWASWCGPCRKENPNVVKAYAKYHSKGLEIIGVSLDSKKEAWVKAVNDDKLSWIHVSDLKGWSNAAAVLYGVKLVPTNVLLDKTGKIIGRNLRGEELEKKLEKIFNL